MDIKVWLKQPSTWKAISVFAGLAGYTISPENVEQISAAVILVYGLISGFWDKN